MELVARLAAALARLTTAINAVDAKIGSGGGSGISILNFHADATANLTLTNQVATEQGLGNSNRNESYFDATSFTQVRVVTRVVTLSAAANARLIPQYSTNGTSWTTIGSGTGTQSASLATPAGNKKSDWITLPAGAKGDVMFRIAQIGGDGAADPAVGTTSLQFK
jgi:hypothetical protein